MSEVSPAMIPLDQAPFTFRTLQEVARTEFVPKAIRGNVPALLAAVMAGREIGLPPMMALRSIDVIDGNPQMSGELMLSIVRGAGHKIRFKEMSNTRVTVEGVRAEDPTDTLVVTWTIEDAKTAGLANKNNWKNYPRIMLAWRAVTELCRFHFPDVLAAKLNYTPDEFGDDQWHDSGPIDAMLAAEPKREAVDDLVVEEDSDDIEDVDTTGIDILDEGVVVDGSLPPRERLQTALFAIAGGDEAKARELAMEGVRAHGYGSGWFESDVMVNRVIEWAGGRVALTEELGAVEVDDDVILVEPNTDEVVVVTAAQQAEMDQIDAEAAQWSEIMDLLATDPKVGTNDAIEKRVRRLFMLMSAVGRWPADHFHARLMAWFGAEHWVDLRVKANFQEFASRAWAEAQEEAAKED